MPFSPTADIWLSVASLLPTFIPLLSLPLESYQFKPDIFRSKNKTRKNNQFIQICHFRTYFGRLKKNSEVQRPAVDQSSSLTTLQITVH